MSAEAGLPAIFVASRVRTAIQPWSQQVKGVHCGGISSTADTSTEAIDAVMARSQEALFRLEWAQVCLLWG